MLRKESLMDELLYITLHYIKAFVMRLLQKKKKNVQKRVYGSIAKVFFKLFPCLSHSPAILYKCLMLHIMGPHFIEIKNLRSLVHDLMPLQKLQVQLHMFSDEV
jgi:hypothetical protein